MISRSRGFLMRSIFLQHRLGDVFFTIDDHSLAPRHDSIQLSLGIAGRILRDRLSGEAPCGERSRWAAHAAHIRPSSRNSRRNVLRHGGSALGRPCRGRAARRSPPGSASPGRRDKAAARPESTLGSSTNAATADAVLVAERPHVANALPAHDLAADHPIERAAVDEFGGAFRHHAGPCGCARASRRFCACP